MYYGIDFLRRVNLSDKVEIGENVVVVGGGNSAIDAARTVLRLGAKEVTIVYRRSLKEMPADRDEIEEAKNEGIKIRFLTTPTKFSGEIGVLKNMECIRMKLGLPDESGRRRPEPVTGSEFVIPVDMVIITIGQSPDTSYLPENTNISINKWGGFIVDTDTLQTSVPGIFAGGDAVRGPDTVIWAIADGKRAAVSIERYLSGLDLKKGRIELEKVKDIRLPRIIRNTKREKICTLSLEKRKGNFNEVNLGYTEEQVKSEAMRCFSCGGCIECRECEKVCEQNAIDHNLKDRIIEEEVGAIIVATGCELYPIEKIPEYGAGKYEDVINGLQFERLLSASGPTDGQIKRPSDNKVPKRVVFVSCVGSRDPEHHLPYCSKICCMYTAKQAMLYKHKVPNGEAIIFYIDIRAGGKGYEEFVERAQKEDVMYIRGKVSKIYRNNGKLNVLGVDTLIGKQLEIECDMVVLSMAMVPDRDIDDLLGKLKIAADKHGFLSEAHPKLRPVESISAGVFVAGAAQAPKDIPEVVAQASGAASKVADLFSSKELKHEPIVACVDEDICSGCGVCIPLCPYDARELELVDEKLTAKVNAVLCEGCGSCIAACPSGATGQKNFMDRQICGMIDAALLK